MASRIKGITVEIGAIQRSGEGAVRCEQFHKEDPEPAAGM